MTRAEAIAAVLGGQLIGAMLTQLLFTFGLNGWLFRRGEAFGRWINRKSDSKP